MRILGIDTATWTASVGLRVDGELAAEASRTADGSHAVSLLALVHDVLQAGRCAVHELDAVAVAGGPGSFTGLRIGLSVAKGISYATGARLVAVPTLEALARTVSHLEGNLCPTLDARKGEVYAACFRSSAAGVERLSDDVLLSPEALLRMLPTPCVVLGDAVGVYGALLRQRLGDGVILLSEDTYGPSGGVVAAMGIERLAAGEPDDLTQLEPRYIRPSEAELKWV